MKAELNLPVSYLQNNPFHPTFDFPVRLSEKYRPRCIAEFVGLERPKRISSKFVARPYDCSFIFYGPPGVGRLRLHKRWPKR